MSKAPGDLIEFCVCHVNDEEALKRCWRPLKELRPHLQSDDELVACWSRQREEGYRLVSIEQNGVALAALGYRVMTTLAWGKIIYVDDLVALEEHRGRGLGTRLLRWIKDECRRLGADAVHLDTGYQRHAGHKAYLRNDFELNCHHLAWRCQAED